MTVPRSYVIDMDGVLVKGQRAIPGAVRFINALRTTKTPFIVLTNNSRFTVRDLQARLRSTGFDIPEENIFTSALATAAFLRQQRPGGTAYAIGEAGLTSALHAAGYILTEQQPDYVVLGEVASYSFESITIASRLVAAGARFIATSPDVTGPSEAGIIPDCGAVAALITAASGKKAYFVGKPNPLMMREALRRINAHSADTVMIGDRMDTDVVSGLESGMQTILVLSGVTRRKDLDRYPFRPGRVIDSVAELVAELTP